MGLLDEAIREHLELKRRRGVDPAEIARQEREALGPSRRPNEAVGVADEPVAAAAPAVAEWDERQEPAVAEPGLDELDEGGAVEDWDEAGEPEEDEVDDLDEVEDLTEPRTQVVEAPPRDAAAPPPPAPPAQTGDAGQATSEYDVLAEDEGPASEPSSLRPQEDLGPEEADDVLEETPEFLQETPEHDRLWFEQRPPRDFDFDG
jgi:hypothetical protein